MSNPKVSICIPAYGGPELIGVCLESVVQQTYQDYEVVITDDSSENDVSDVVDRFKGKIASLRYYKNRTRLGSPINWNECVRRAKGEYIKLLHHDDWFSEVTSLQKFVDLLDNNPRASLAFCASNAIGKENQVLYVRTADERRIRMLRRNAESLLLRNIIGAPSSTIYRKTHLEFNGLLMWLVDIDFYIRLLSANRSFAYSNEPLINITANGEHQITRLCRTKEIDLFESLYLYPKIRNLSIRLQYALQVLRRLHRYRVYSIDDIPKKEYLHMNAEIHALILLHGVAHSMRFVIKLMGRLWKWLASLYFYAGFVRDYVTFSKLSLKNPRFPLRMLDLYPRLSDNTKTTRFDTHYIYHPAWAARIIRKLNPDIHTDISSTLAFSALLSAFIPVRFFDYRPANIALSDLSSSRADLLSLPFPDNSIKSLSCMHTVEHIGLGRYGDPLDPEGDLKAIRELKRVIARNGSLLLVVPIGVPRLMFNAHRIYSYDQVISYFDGFALKHFSLIPDNANEVGMIDDVTGELANQQTYGCGCFWFIKL